MGQLNLQINGRSYEVACDDGQEEHLTELGEYVAKQAEGLAGSLGQIADSRLLLMTSLVIADELGESLAVSMMKSKSLSSTFRSVSNSLQACLKLNASRIFSFIRCSI